MYTSSSQEKLAKKESFESTKIELQASIHENRESCRQEGSSEYVKSIIWSLIIKEKLETHVSTIINTADIWKNNFNEACKINNL